VSRPGERRWGGREKNRGRGRERETERDERRSEGKEEQETERGARERWEAMDSEGGGRQSGQKGSLMHAYQWVMSYMCMSHGTHMKESWHTYE